jgi:hypothetical protein
MDTARKRPGRALRWGVVLTVLVAVTAGCNPWNSFYYFLMPEPRIPPECKLTVEDQEKGSRVVIMSSRTMDLRPEVFNADYTLVEGLIQTVQKRLDEDGDKVKLVPAYQVRGFTAKQAWPPAPYDVGKHFDADYVVHLEIVGLSLYKKGSVNTLYEGSTEIALSVTDMKGPREQGPVWRKEYSCEFPRSGPEPVDSNPVGQFRARFLSRVVTDLARYFTSSRTSDRFD